MNTINYIVLLTAALIVATLTIGYRQAHVMADKIFSSRDTEFVEASGVAERDGVAHGSEGRRTLTEMLNGAQLAFMGVVENIEYVLCKPKGPEQVQIPYTFVTYRVEEILKGQGAGTMVILRFIGGLNPLTGSYMATSRTPQFDLGDRDILFVQGNTERMCPLVGTKAGRLRIVDGQVYTDGGQSVTIGDNGDLGTGRYYRLKEVESTLVNGNEYRITYGPGVRELPSDAVGVEKVIEAIRALAPSSEWAGEFINANPSQSFDGPDLTPVPPPSNKKK